MLVPSTADALGAAKAGYRWVTKSTLGTKYLLTHPAQFTNKMLALLDFDVSDPTNEPISGTDIRQSEQPDPHDFVYVGLRKHEPKITAYIRTRDLTEILGFLAKSANIPSGSVEKDLNLGAVRTVGSERCGRYFHDTHTTFRRTFASKAQPSQRQPSGVQLRRLRTTHRRFSQRPNRQPESRLLIAP